MNRPTHSFDESEWSAFVAEHAVGDALTGHVVRLVPFGAFVRIGNSIDGLAPQASWPITPEVGAPIQVRIAAIDSENHRLALDPL